MKKEKISESPIRVGMCGFGTVGKGVFLLLNQSSEKIYTRMGRSISITHVGLRRKYPEVSFSNCQISKDMFAVASDPNIDIFILIHKHRLKTKYT